MKTYILLLAFLFPLWGSGGYAQTTDISPQGVFVPHLNTTQRSAISSPTNGQMIYNIDINCFEVFQNSVWQKLCGLEGTVEEKWTQKANVGGIVRSYAVGFAIGDKGYVGTGVYNNVYFKDFWEFNPQTNVWSQKADFGGTARGYAIGFSIKNKGYVGTGYDNLYRKDFWQYDPSNNLWTQKADFGGVERAEAVGLSVGNKGYVGTGTTTDSSLRDFWEYNPIPDTWTRKADFGGTPRNGGFKFAIGNKIFVGTGFDEVANDNTSDFYEYDIPTNHWTNLAEFGGGKRYGAYAFAIGSRGFVVAGQDQFLNGSYGRDDFWEYDPIGQVWLQKDDFVGSKRDSGISFSINGKGYIGTGNYNGGTLNDFWEYNPNVSNLTTQGNIVNGANQLLKLDGNGNINITGKKPLESYQIPTLLNNWVNFGNTFSGASYFKDDDDMVYLEGVIKNGIATLNTNLFTLPNGYRPSERLIFTVSNSNAYGRVDVFPTGEVQIQKGGNVYLNLSNIQFRANGD
jgi:hypothetical protein